MKVICFVVLVLVIASCNNEAPAPVVKPAPPKYTASMVDNKRDFSCGMPVTAGIGDTAHYKGKIYGFCSKECKDIFLTKPDSFLLKYKQ
jgi:YHS domain-containing protein